MLLQHSMYYRIGLLSLSIALSLYCNRSALAYNPTDAIQFNMDVLDVEDKKNINLDHFSRPGYIMPGKYNLALNVNNDSLPEMSIPFYIPDTDPDGSIACLSPEIANKLGLTESNKKKLKWWHNGECLDFTSLAGMSAKGDLATSTLYITIPQAYMEYMAPNWDPPSRWDNGISAIILDYSINGNTYRPNNGLNTYTLNGNGIAGINLGSWRFRGDWQGRLNHATGSNHAVNNDFRWSRIYAYRALPTIGAKLILGEDYLNSSMFDSFNYAGASVQTDLNMMPPNMRGYAPEVTGIAQTNATVIISQQGRVIFSEQVAPGPFRIQNLSDAVSGTLNVKVEEQNGTVQEFQVETANLPYLTRPGQTQYKFSLGKPTNYNRGSDGKGFVTGELSWGINNGWSLFGGTLNSKKYNALSLGIGRDLLALGALSLDVTKSIARLNNGDRLSGGSYRLSYAKRFDAIDSQIQFAGYRFSDRDFMSMSDFLQANNGGYRYSSNKELYTVSFSKNFRDAGLSVYLNFNHQTYWNAEDRNYYSLTASKYFDFGSIKNISINMTASRNFSNNMKDDSFYLSTSFPLTNGANIGYALNKNSYDTVSRATYNDQIDDRTNYQISAGNNRKGATGSAFITHQGDVARIAGNASYMHNQYSAFGLSATGGLTLTANGGGIHRMNSLGGSRLLVDTNGVPNVPVRGFGAPVTSNIFGKAIINDVNSYYRSKAYIDLNTLPDNVEAQNSVVQLTLTEGSVGYREFSVISGAKAMVSIRLQDGSYPPFGASITNDKGKNTGIVADAGSAYISGIQDNSVMDVSWGEGSLCQITFPANVASMTDALLLPCVTSK